MYLYNPRYANGGILGSQHPQSLLLKALLISFFALSQLSSFTVSLLFSSTFSLLSDSAYCFAYLCSALLLFTIIASKALFHPCYIHVNHFHCNIQVYYCTQIECCIQPCSIQHFPSLLYYNQAFCSHKRLCYILIDVISCYNISLSTSKFATPSSHTSSRGTLKTQPFYCSSFTYLVKRVHLRKGFGY